MHNQLAISAHVPEATLSSVPSNTPKQVYRFAKARKRREKRLHRKGTQSLYAARVLRVIPIQ
jgi:hypothetical protein